MEAYIGTIWIHGYIFTYGCINVVDNLLDMLAQEKNQQKS